MLATKSAGARCCECPVVLLLWWSAWCRGKNDPSTGHGSHGQRKTYILPGGHLKLSVVAGCCRSFYGATTHLDPAAKSLQSDEVRAAPNQLARTDTSGKIPIDPSPHSWYMPIL